ncbi:hypothetical protein OQA88_705 [Cercophora sp. LCS_1]
MAEPIEIGVLVPDDNDTASAIVSVRDESDNTSLKSSILRYRQENGRTYHAYKDGTYFLPNDEGETERLDFQHHIFLLSFDDKLHLAPLPEKLNRVLDIGCGTGVWSIDFADEHPEAHVTGVDLSPIQPSFAPPNVTFFVDDVEDDWTYTEKFDYIFSHFMTGSVANWPKLFRQCFDNLNPGGVIEVQDIVWTLESDDDSLDPESDLVKWVTILREGMGKFGRSVESALQYREQLEAAGFIDIVEVKHKWPINKWPKDPKYKEIGMWSYENFVSGMQGFSLAILTRPKDQGGLG